VAKQAGIVDMKAIEAKQAAIEAKQAAIEAKQAILEEEKFSEIVDTPEAREALKAHLEKNFANAQSKETLELFKDCGYDPTALNYLC
jgi:hypothetical protein